MGYQSFRELRVWQEARQLAITIYETTAQGDIRRDYSFRDQLRRSAVSIASNIAEGYERYSDKDFIRFLFIAKGSLAELITQLEIAEGIGYLKGTVLMPLEEQCNKIGAMLTQLIRARRTKAAASRANQGESQ